MRYVKFGSTGLFVSELCLGTMTFGGEGIWKAIGALDQGAAEALIGRARDAGINFIDTADVYSLGQSETITGQALRNLRIPRDEVVVATKAYGETGKGPNARGASRAHLLDAVHASLRRLQLDHIDLYQIHGFDPATPVAETVQTLDLLVRQGLVRYIGVSNWAAWQVMKALGISELRGLAPVNCLQAYYTVAGRELERELLPLAASEGLALMIWSPLAGGMLSGKYRWDKKAESGSRRNEFDFPPVDRDAVNRCVDVMRPMALTRGVSIAQIAIAWLLHQPAVTSVIVGAKTVAQLEDNIGATRVELTADELALLAAAAPPTPEYPGWMLERMGEYRRKQLQSSQRK